jgi:hypothetical protein
LVTLIGESPQGFLVSVFEGTCPAGPLEIYACSSLNTQNINELTFSTTANVPYLIMISTNDLLASTGQGTFKLESLGCTGCTDLMAFNYNPLATFEDGSCSTLPNCPSDFNGDGSINVSDLGGFLGAFGTSCTQITFYADNDGDSYGDSNNSILAPSAPAGYVFDNTDCNDLNPDINPGAIDICDGLDNDCDGDYDEDVALPNTGDPCTTYSCVNGSFVIVQMTCDDGISCTFDYCDNGICVYLPDDSLCDDGIFCNGQETCSPVSGCTPGNLSNLDDGNACTIDFCDEATQSIIHQPIICDDGNDCTSDACNPATGACEYVPVNNGTLCDDGDPTTSKACINGECLILSVDMDLDGYDSSIDCDDNNPDINPRAIDICDGLDNDCDGDYDNEDGSDCDGICEPDEDGSSDCDGVCDPEDSPFGPDCN